MNWGCGHDNDVRLSGLRTSTKWLAIYFEVISRTCTQGQALAKQAEETKKNPFARVPNEENMGNIT
jgi:hypothetical protein